MKLKYLCCGVAAAGAVALTGCVDDKYDLSDIDTTTRIQVNDLVLPVNIDAVTLSDIIAPDDNSKIKAVTINGEEFYALTESGKFSSDDIHVDKVTATAPYLAPTQRTLDQVVSESRARRRAGSVAGDYTCTYEIVEMGNDFSYHADNVDDAIVTLTSAKVEPMDFKVHLEALNVDGKVEKMYFTDLKIQMPYGLTATVSDGGKYDPTTGIWSMPSKEVIGNVTDAKLTTTEINFADNGCEVKDHKLYFDGQFRVKSGLLTIEPKFINGVPQPLPEKLEFRVSYEIDNLVANSFTGVINYKLDGMDINPVSLSDIPDFLSGDETVINLANPQIYLSLNNPVAGDNLDCVTGLTLSAIRDGAPTYDYSPSGKINIDHNLGVVGPYNFALAPDKEKLTVPEGYGPNPTFIEFLSLSNLLGTPEDAAVKGLPDRIGIHLEDPEIPTSPVTDFALGKDIVGVDGKYELMAPLALSNGSTIVYTDTEDGWNDEDVDAITISKLTVTATVANATPLGVTLTAWPIDKEGKRIPGVELTSNHIPANTAGENITIEMTGTITHLDGVTFEARVNAGKSEETLKPSQTVTLTNIRAKVTGYYEKEL